MAKDQKLGNNTHFFSYYFCMLHSQVAPCKTKSKYFSQLKLMNYL